MDLRQHFVNIMKAVQNVLFSKIAFWYLKLKLILNTYLGMFSNMQGKEICITDPSQNGSQYNLIIK